jgi:L-rhamnose mutarotase
MCFPLLKEEIKMSKTIFGQVGKLKKDKIDEYIMLHANPWQSVLDKIHDCNLRNYSIFLHGDLVFAYFEYIGDYYEKDMEKIAEDETTQLWWTKTMPCFEKFAMGSDSPFYSDMKQIFYLN